MNHSDNLGISKRYVVRYGISICILLLAALGLCRMCRPEPTQSRSMAIADVLVLKPVLQSEAEQIVKALKEEIKNDLIKIQWSNQGQWKDRKLLSSETGVEDTLLYILTTASGMDSSQIQKALKKAVWRSSAIEVSEVFSHWSLVMVGPLKYQENLMEADETEALRNNPKLSAWFFLPPPISSDDTTLEVSDALIHLLRNTGTQVERRLMW